jgi:hypothetical protein
MRIGPVPNGRIECFRSFQSLCRQALAFTGSWKMSAPIAGGTISSIRSLS